MIFSYDSEGSGRTVGGVVPAVHPEYISEPLPVKPYSSIILASIQSLQLVNFLFLESYLSWYWWARGGGGKGVDRWAAVWEIQEGLKIKSWTIILISFRPSVWCCPIAIGFYWNKSVLSRKAPISRRSGGLRVLTERLIGVGEFSTTVWAVS